MLNYITGSNRIFRIWRHCNISEFGFLLFVYFRREDVMLR